MRLLRYDEYLLCVYLIAITVHLGYPSMACPIPSDIQPIVQQNTFEFYQIP